MTNKTDRFGVSFPAGLRRELDRTAKSKGQSRSAILQDAFRRQSLRDRLEVVQNDGRRVALEFGIETEEDLLAFLKK